MRHCVRHSPLAVVQQWNVEAEHSPIIFLMEVVVGNNWQPHHEQTRQERKVNVVVFHSQNGGGKNQSQHHVGDQVWDFNRALVDFSDLVGDSSFERSVKSVILECQIVISRECGIADVKFSQKLFRLSCYVMRLELLGDVDALGHFQPFCTTWMTLHELTDVIKLVVDSPQAFGIVIDLLPLQPPAIRATKGFELLMRDFMLRHKWKIYRFDDLLNGSSL